MTKRKIFDEMMEGIAAMKSHREGKITLRTYKVKSGAAPEGGLEIDSRHPQEAKLLTSRFCSPLAH